MKEIVSIFRPLVGFNTDPNFDNLIQEDIESESGLYFQDAHPLLSLLNIKAASPIVLNKEMSDVQFLEWLHKKKDAAILKTLLAVRTNRNLQLIEKTVLSKAEIFEGGGNVKDMEIKEGRFVGYQLVLKNPNQLVVSLNQICLQMSEAQDVTMYFYHSSEPQPVFTKEYRLERSKLPNWIDADDLELICSKSQLFGGYWVIGYYEDDIVGQSLNKTGFDFVRGGCNCGGIDFWKQWNPYLSLQPISVPASAISVDKLMPSENDFVYTKDKTYGINFMFSVSCSTKNIFINQKEKFANAIQLQFCVDMLNEIAFTSRTNAISEKTQQKAMFDLEDKEHSIGLKTKLDKELKSINISLEKLGAICMPSQPRVTYSTT